MAAVAKNPAFAKKVGIKSSVGEEFLKADKGKKFGSGGYTRADIQKVNKPKTDHGKMAFFKEGGSTMATKNNGITSAKMGSVRTAAPSKDGIAERGKTKGKQRCVACALFLISLCRPCNLVTIRQIVFGNAFNGVNRIA